MERRQFLKSSSALLGIFPLLQANYFQKFATGAAADAEVVTFTVGKIKCTVFRDLTFKYLAKDFFINAGQEELTQSLHKFNITPDNIPSPFIALLLQQGDRKILIDTGIGFSKEPVVFRGSTLEFKGRLHHLLQQEKIAREAITDVIITHLHPDHIGGIYSVVGRLNFPNARFHLHEDEWKYWHSSASDTQPALFKYFIENNITKLKDLNLNLIKGDFTDLLPGVTAVKAEGHTPGQIALVLRSQKQHLLYISDAFLHPLHIERLDWQTNYDMDHQKAKQTRAKLLDLAYQDNMLVNAFHFDFPGLGRVEKQKGSWNWTYTQK